MTNYEAFVLIVGYIASILFILAMIGIGGVLIDPTGPGMGTMLNKFSIELTPEYMNLFFLSIF